MADMATANPGSPPSAASRRAFTPQVGASAQEMGRDHPGSSASPVSRPVTSQIGYSSRFESAFACRYMTKVDASTSPSRPSASTATGRETKNQAGWTSSKGTSKKSQPQMSVEVSE